MKSIHFRVLLYLLLSLNIGLGQGAIEAPEIVDISISGNRYIGTNELLSQIRLKEKRLFSSGSFFNQHHLTREIQRLENYYTLNGFLDAEIKDSLDINDDNKMSIYLTVTEGKEYFLKSITLSGNTVFSDQEYLELIEYQVGSSFNTFKIRENLLEMVTLYRNNGYPLIKIQDKHIIDDSVRLFIDVDEGPKLNIGSINIIPTEQVPTDIIRREIIIDSGDVFNMADIEESKRRLYETSLFNSANIRMGKVDTGLATIDLNVDVIAAKFRAFDMNFGVKQGPLDETPNSDPVLSVGLLGSWYHNNLFNRSRRIRVQTQVRSILPLVFIPQKFGLDFFYVEPWLAKYRIPLTINPFYWYIDNANTGFNNTAYGLRAILAYRWFRTLKIQSLAEWSRANTVGTATEDEGEVVYATERKVGVKLLWDRRDSYFYPKSGFKLTVEPNLVGYFLEGENHYIQFQTAFSSYWNLFRNVVFAHNINFSAAVQRFESSPIPLEKRFYLGGNSSIRGYQHQMLGPMSSNEPTGGNLRYFTNFELRFPLYKILGGEVFFDAGNIWSKMEQAQISDVQMAAGVGITIDTPIGPARIDYGVPVGSNALSDQGQVHIAIAYAF